MLDMVAGGNAFFVEEIDWHNVELWEDVGSLYWGWSCFMELAPLT